MTMNDDRPSPTPARVAILLFDEVEVLDFAGPFEVFAVTRQADGAAAFEVVTVAVKPGPIVARNGLRITPAASAATVGPIDILVIPGGFGTRALLADVPTLDFIRSASAGAALTLSVCTGALLLATAGLLRGKAATTHWAAIDELRALAPGTTIHPDARIVDNGRLVLSAGVSAGIDAAFHIVARWLGESQAAHTARYMDYQRGLGPVVTA
jgi:transcriptional regulator GlxA family with amidase domain